MEKRKLKKKTLSHNIILSIPYGGMSYLLIVSMVINSLREKD